MFNNKIFIIGLPRTATTSVCIAFLELGYKTAHTAYTKACFEEAQVIADTPVFCDYQALDRAYPESKFINLVRPLDKWLPSIRQLLLRMHTNLQRTDGGFNPHLKRCYNQIFSPLTIENIKSDEFLIDCYQRHQQQIAEFFKSRPDDLLTIDVSHADSFAKLLSFIDFTDDVDGQAFKLINKGGKVTAWNDIKHPLKVASTRNGRIDSTL